MFEIAGGIILALIILVSIGFTGWLLYGMLLWIQGLLQPKHRFQITSTTESDSKD